MIKLSTKVTKRHPSRREEVKGGFLYFHAAHPVAFSDEEKSCEEILNYALEQESIPMTNIDYITKNLKMLNGQHSVFGLKLGSFFVQQRTESKHIFSVTDMNYTRLGNLDYLDTPEQCMGSNPSLDRFLNLIRMKV